MAPASRSRRRRIAGRIVAGVLGALVLVAVGAAAWVSVRGSMAYGHLEKARASASTLTDRIDDPAAAAASISAIADDAASAHALTSDPVWRAVETVPWLGPQLGAIGTIAAAADEVAGTALQPLADVASTFSVDALRPVDGVIDTAPIAGLHDAAQAGSDGMRGATASVDRIDVRPLLAPLRAPIEEFRTLLHSVADGADALARASTLMPAMLGADGARSYLVVFQNNAEWRSLGGIVGATAVVSTDGGRMSLTAQASSGDFRFRDPVLALPDEVLDIYDVRPARFIQNATQVPDFPTAAQIAREMWARVSGVQVDGVLSLDPVALSYLLTATGPVALPTGDVLTSENAVQLLLNEVYLRYERPADQDAFFQAAAAAVFEALSSGGTDPTALVESLARAGGENRLLLWNARPEEQAVLDGTTLQGGLPVTDADRTTFGVYLNDGTGAKMDYYLILAAGVAWCGADEAVLRYRLRSEAPSDAASLPDYITGGEGFGLPRGVTRTVTTVYLPEGAELLGATATTSGSVVTAGTYDARQVLSWTAELDPGEEGTVTVRVRTPRTAALDTRLTPTVYTAETLKVAGACEIPE